MQTGADSAAPPATATAQPSGPTYRVERPPPGLAQGQYAVSPWFIALAAIVMVAAIGFFFWWRHRQHERRNRFQSVSPHSVPPPSSRR